MAKKTAQPKPKKTVKKQAKPQKAYSQAKKSPKKLTKSKAHSVKKIAAEKKDDVLTKDFQQIAYNTKIDVNDELPVDLEKYLNAFRKLGRRHQNHGIIFAKLFVIIAALFIVCFIIYKLIFG